MALTVQCILATTLPTSSPTPATYNPGTGKGAIIKSVLFVNLTGNAVQVTATLKKGGTGTGTNICPPNMYVPAASSITLDSEITMSDSDLLTLYAASAGSIDCVVSGMVRDN